MSEAALDTTPAPGATPDATSESTPAPEASWRDALPAELRDNASLADVKDVAGLAKRFVDTKAMVGNSLRIPGPDAAPEAMAQFRQTLMEKNLGLTVIPEADDKEGMRALYRQLGLPEDTTGYARPEQWDGMTDERYGALAAVAHEAGISKQQFEYISGKMAEADNQLVAGYREEQQAGIDQLKGEWGRAYDQKVARAHNVAKQLEAPEALIGALESGDVDASTLRWMDKMAEKLSGEGSALVKEAGAVSEFTPTEAREQMNEITQRMMGMNANDPMYQPLLQKRIKLAEMLSAG